MLQQLPVRLQLPPLARPLAAAQGLSRADPRARRTPLGRGARLRRFPGGHLLTPVSPDDRTKKIPGTAGDSTKNMYVVSLQP